jgi:leader peptidase (prepilin peptidase)/N-methyltransferase
LLLVWLTAVGGCIGSFLNVVIYRLPRRESLSHPPSRCPHCGHAIRWRHNVPVLGWLLLGGKCWDCRAPIAVRYPVVEAAVAFVFFVLAASGPLSASAWSFYRSGEASGVAAAAYWITYIWELILVCTLLALALIDRDLMEQPTGHFPQKWLGTVFFLGLALPILWPQLLAFVVGRSPADPEVPSIAGAASHAGFGALAGCGAGCLMFAASRRTRDSLRQAALPALVGTYCGTWLLIALVALTLLVFALILAVPLKKHDHAANPRWSWPLLFFAATVASLIAIHWRPMPIALLGSSPLFARFAIAGALLGALLAYAAALRAPSGRAES